MIGPVIRDPYIRHFARHLRYWMARKGVRQSELADALGLDASSVTAWKLGKNFPSFGNVYRICVEVLGIDLWQFFREPRERFRRERGRMGVRRQRGRIGIPITSRLSDDSSNAAA